MLSILIVPAALPFILALCLRAFAFTPVTGTASTRNINRFADMDLQEQADIQMRSMRTRSLSRNDDAFVIDDSELDANPFIDGEEEQNVSMIFEAQEIDLGESLDTSAHFRDRTKSQRPEEPVKVVDSIPADWQRFDSREQNLDDFAPLSLENPFEGVEEHRKENK